MASASTPTAPASVCGSGPSAAAATDNAAADARLATTRYARSRRPRGSRRDCHCAASEKPARMLRASSKTRGRLPGAASGPRPHCSPSETSSAGNRTRTGACSRSARQRRQRERRCRRVRGVAQHQADRARPSALARRGQPAHDRSGVGRQHQRGHELWRRQQDAGREDQRACARCAAAPIGPAPGRRAGSVRRRARRWRARPRAIPRAAAGPPSRRHRRAASAISPHEQLQRDQQQRQDGRRHQRGRVAQVRDEIGAEREGQSAK